MYENFALNKVIFLHLFALSEFLSCDDYLIVVEDKKAQTDEAYALIFLMSLNDKDLKVKRHIGIHQAISKRCGQRSWNNFLEFKI